MLLSGLWEELVWAIGLTFMLIGIPVIALVLAVMEIRKPTEEDDE